MYGLGFKTENFTGKDESVDTKPFHNLRKEFNKIKPYI